LKATLKRPRLACNTAYLRYGRISHIFPPVANRPIFNLASLLDLTESGCGVCLKVASYFRFDYVYLKLLPLIVHPNIPFVKQSYCGMCILEHVLFSTRVVGLPLHKPKPDISGSFSWQMICTSALSVNFAGAQD